ncbi:glr0790 [Gloeobacter violaceus PCC 7421]|uniref:Glr0790 protein n=2 Tax=Gloeobacter violaceus TaxID=33072 RepID=Q7NMH6_GLOVI|nr:glr0790 [Gloeobacter violaceus PCC 7421]
MTPTFDGVFMAGLLRRLGAAAILTIGLTASQSVAASPTIQNLQVRQQQLQEKLQSTRRQAVQLRLKEKVARSRLGAIRQNLTVTTNKLQDSRYRLSVAQQRLVALKRDLGRLQTEFSSLQRAAAERLRFLQKQRPEQWWALLLASRDLNTLMDRRQQLGKVFERDQQLLEALDTRREQVTRKRSAVENQKNDIALIAQQLAGRRSQFARQASIQSELVQRLSTQRAAYEAAQRRLAADSKRVSAMIRTIIASERRYNSVQGSGRMILPTEGRLSSQFGMRHHPIFKVRKMHTGIDVAARSGTPIRAADDGTVLYAGWYGGYGRCVIVSHGGTLSTLYAHASRLFVTVGQTVKKGDPLAAVGSTGFSTGPHLHFEVRVNGSPVNPLDYLR